MSERYGICRNCQGSGKNQITAQRFDGEKSSIVLGDCGTCGGTGHSGDATDYRENQERLDHAVDNERSEE